VIVAQEHAAAVPRRAAVRRVRPWQRGKACAESAPPFRQRVADHLQEVLLHSGLGRREPLGGGGFAVSSPTVTDVQLGRGVVVAQVRLLAGQLVDDARAERHRIAEAFGAPHVRVIPRGPGRVTVEVHRIDPLIALLPLPVVTCRSSAEQVLLGVTEDGEYIAARPVAMSHTVVQGGTRQGKSTFLYALLAQLCGAEDIVIAGSDPSALTLGRPFDGTVHREWQAAGYADLEAHADVLERLVAELDGRLRALPARADTVLPDSGCPLVIVVVEELANLLRAASLAPRARDAIPVADRIRTAIGRLAAESHKVAMRLIVVSQRADAKVIGDRGERGQFLTALSFATRDPEALEMLHPGARDLAREHGAAPKGVALLSAPGRELVRVRTPLLHYADYVDRVNRVFTRQKTRPDRCRGAAGGT
jgi:DNA segregation ATPase FtsK/SpoIIIE, S-DNA-T family